MVNKNDLFFLASIWLLHSALVLLLAYGNPNHFTTIDSTYYLASADHLLHGRGHRYEEEGRLIWNSTFPIGYPATIAGVSLISGLPVLWASKLINLLASGVLLCLLARWFPAQKALVTGCLLLVGEFVKLWAHTWSEPLFLVLLFAWAYLFFHADRRHYLIFLLGVALLLVRYAGVFIIPLSGIRAGIHFWKHQRTQARTCFWLAVGWAFVLGNYLNYNLYQSGEWYGGERFGDFPDLLSTLVLFGEGLLNEFFLFRDLTFSHPDMLFAIGLGVQLFLMLLFLSNREARTLLPLYPVRFAYITALSYLLFLLLIRLLSPFDAPGYRLLAPFSFLFFWAILARIPASAWRGKRMFIGWAAILASWLHLLPQADMEAKLKPLWHWLGIG